MARIMKEGLVKENGGLGVRLYQQQPPGTIAI